MLKILCFFKDYWYVPFMVLGAVGGLALVMVLRSAGKDAGDPFEKVGSELKVIEAGREAREARINQGEAAALQAVNDKYAAKRETLDFHAETKIKKYENDPVALARAMERVSRR